VLISICRRDGCRWDWSLSRCFLPAIKAIWGRSAGDVYLGTSNGIYHGVP
jgi:hypothetical protein